MPKRQDGTPPSSGKAADPELSQRFIDTARVLGCEENLDRFDEAVKRIGRARRQPPAVRKVEKEIKPK